MPKTYVLDTNVLLYNPMAIYAFSDNDVVIPLPVIEEIDNCKKAQDEIGRHARIVSRELDALRETGRLSTGVRLKNGGSLRIELNHQKIAGLPEGLDSGKYDNRILAVALGLSQEEDDDPGVSLTELARRIEISVPAIYPDPRISMVFPISKAADLHLPSILGVGSFYLSLPDPDPLEVFLNGDGCQRA